MASRNRCTYRETGGTEPDRLPLADQPAAYLTTSVGVDSRPTGLASARPAGAAWTPARAARARVKGRRRRSRRDAQRPCRRPAAARDLAGWPRARPVRVRVQGPGRGAGTAGEAVSAPGLDGQPIKAALHHGTRPGRRRVDEAKATLAQQ